MKVVQINEYCGIGSTGKICLELARMLEENGHKCKIVYGRKKAAEEAESYGIRITSDFGVRIHGMETRILDNHAFASTLETLKLLVFLKKFEPDIIHLHNMHGYYINIAILFRYIRKNRIPVIWTLHDCWAMTGHCAHFYHVGCDRWMTGCYDCPQKKEYPASYIVDNSKRNWGRKKKIFTGLEKVVIITPSVWLSTLANKSYLNKYPIKVVSNGIDLACFYPRKDNIFDKKFGKKKIILGVSSIWNKNKGIYDFLYLYDVLDKSKFQIVLVGKIEKRLKIPSEIMVINRTESAEKLAHIYSSADIYVNVSRVETLGMTTIEALACGCPVVTYEAGGSAECVGIGCGKVIENYNLDLLIKAIQEIALYDRKMTRKICVQHAKKFSKERMVRDYYFIYEELIRDE